MIIDLCCKTQNYVETKGKRSKVQIYKFYAKYKNFTLSQKGGCLKKKIRIWEINLIIIYFVLTYNIYNRKKKSAHIYRSS